MLGIKDILLEDSKFLKNLELVEMSYLEEGKIAQIAGLLVATLGMAITGIAAPPSSLATAKQIVSTELPGKNIQGGCEIYGIALSHLLQKYGATQIFGYVLQWGSGQADYHFLVSFLYQGKRYIVDNMKTPVEAKGLNPNQWAQQLGYDGKIVSSTKLPCNPADIKVFTGG